MITHQQIIADDTLRISYGEMSFFFWFQYHFGFKAKKFHKKRMDSMQSSKSTFIEAFRASRKTTIARGFVCWCIVYKKEPSIVVQSYEDGLSAERVRECVKMLFLPSIIRDHGELFPTSSTKEDINKRSFSNFESRNGVKVEAKSLGQTIRGTNTFDISSGVSARPTLLILDDIDVDKSVSNINIINQNERKIMGETIGALDPLRRKIIFLGNTIMEDGIVPRFKNRYKDTDTWDIFHQPLFIGQENVRPEIFTDDIVQKLRDDGKTAFGQNYLLTPAVNGAGIFIRSYFDYFLLSHFEDPETYLKKTDLKCGMFIDPATSSDSKSDDAVILGVGKHKLSNKYYLIDGYADTSAPSKTYQAVIVVYNNMIANGFKPEFISVESATINTKQTQFIKDLKEVLIQYQIMVPIHLYESKINKMVRIKTNLEAIMSQQGIKFNRNILDRNLIPKLEAQFLEYPNGDHDDIIDCLSQAVEVFNKKQQPNQQTLPQNIKPSINKLTGMPMKQQKKESVKFNFGFS